MSLPQHIRFGSGGTISVDLRDRPAAASVSVYKGSGAAVVSSRTCNVSAVNTVLVNAASRGDLAINVASNVGLAVGVRCWLQDDPEEILIRKVAAGVITLRRPMLLDHVNNASVEGTRVSCDLNASDANALFWDGHADWNIDGTVAVQTACECTKYMMERSITVQDILDEEPMFYHLVDPKMDVERTLALAHQDVLARIAAKSPEARGRVFPGSSEFTQAAVFAFMERFYRRRPGEDQRQLRTSYETKLTDEIERICGIVPRDADQDGVVEASERLTWGTVRVRR